MERDTGNALRPTTSSTIQINNRSFLHVQGTGNANVNLQFMSGKKWNFKFCLPRSEQRSKSNGANMYYAKKNYSIAGFWENETLAPSQISLPFVSNIVRSNQAA